MTIGETLEFFRLNQGKTKKVWVGNIITPSYYGKIANGIHQIRMDVFLEILQRNNISPLEFFSKYDQSAKKVHDLEREISFQLNTAYYHNSEAEIKRVEHMVEKSSLPDKTKQKWFVIIKVCLANLKNDFSNLSVKEEDVIKQEVFQIEQFDLTSLRLYCDIMGFYDLDDNILLSTKIIKQLITNDDINVQELLITMITNLLIMCIENNKYDDGLPFIRVIDQIATQPRIFFQKNVLLLIKNIIRYHYDNKSEYLTNCQKAIENCGLLGMEEYQEELQKFYSKYI